MAKPYSKEYHIQRASAKHRGIDWQFSYDEWILWWGEDIINRGRKSGNFVMARHNDTGPYHPSNVRKALLTENSSEANKGKLRPRTVEHQLKLNEAQRGKEISDEAKDKIRDFNLGRKDSVKTCIKRSESIKAWWAARKLTGA